MSLNGSMEEKTSLLTEKLLQKYYDDGFVVIENFLDQREIESLMTECRQMIADMDPSEHKNKTIFSSENMQQYRDNYFLNSADKVRYFFEEHALDAEGNLIVDKQVSVNKIGHALHVLCPSFREVSSSEKVKSIFSRLGFIDPVLGQSMYIFKQPQIGGKVTTHQDGTYLYTEPMKALAGLWFALEDATLDNGCLWFMPGSHKDGLRNNYRMVRKTQDDGTLTCAYEGVAPEYDPQDFVPCPVSKGSLVLIDGLVVHKSEPNTSSKSRQVYTFHVYDAAIAQWNERNWIQPTSANTFTHLFKTADIKAGQ